MLTLSSIASIRSELGSAWRRPPRLGAPTTGSCTGTAAGGAALAGGATGGGAVCATRGGGGGGVAGCESADAVDRTSTNRYSPAASTTTAAIARAIRDVTVTE